MLYYWPWALKNFWCWGNHDSFVTPRPLCIIETCEALPLKQFKHGGIRLLLQVLSTPGWYTKLIWKFAAATKKAVQFATNLVPSQDFGAQGWTKNMGLTFTVVKHPSKTCDTIVDRPWCVFTTYHSHSVYIGFFGRSPTTIVTTINLKLTNEMF